MVCNDKMCPCIDHGIPNEHDDGDDYNPYYEDEDDYEEDSYDEYKYI